MAITAQFPNTTISPGKSSTWQNLLDWYKKNTNLPGSDRESPTDRDVSLMTAGAGLSAAGGALEGIPYVGPTISAITKGVSKLFNYGGPIIGAGAAIYDTRKAIQNKQDTPEDPTLANAAINGANALFNHTNRQNVRKYTKDNSGLSTSATTGDGTITNTMDTSDTATTKTPVKLGDVSTFKPNPNLSASIKTALGSQGSSQGNQPLEKMLIVEKPTTGVG